MTEAGVSKAAATGASSRRISPAMAVGATAAIAGAWFFGVIWKYSTDLPYSDQWDFLAPLFRPHAGIAELFFWRHGLHGEGVGLLADKLLYGATGWNVRAESMLIAACIFVSALLALALKRKMAGRLSYSDCVIPLIFLGLGQYETLLGAPNAAYSGFPLLMIMLYCLALFARARALRYGLLLALNFLLVYTGYGLFMGFVTLGVLALEFRRGWRANILPAAAWLIAGASLASFFRNFQPAGAGLQGYAFVTCFQVSVGWASGIPVFVALMFSSFLGVWKPYWMAATVGASVLAVAATALVLYRRRTARDAGPAKWLVPAVLMCESLLYAVNAAVGRECLGWSAAQVSRYKTLLIPLFLALYLCWDAVSGRHLRRIASVVFVVLLLVNAAWIPKGAHRFSEAKNTWAACYLRSGNIELCDAVSGSPVHPDAAATHLREKLEFLKRNRLSLFSSR